MITRYTIFFVFRIVVFKSYWKFFYLRKVYLVGRRGPVQAACTTKELREVLGNFSILSASLTLISRYFWYASEFSHLTQKKIFIYGVCLFFQVLKICLFTYRKILLKPQSMRYMLLRSYLLCSPASYISVIFKCRHANSAFHLYICVYTFLYFLSTYVIHV